MGYTTHASGGKKVDAPNRITYSTGDVSVFQ